MQAKGRAAVVTDTVSSGFYFPAWYKYYSGQVGSQNIYVFSYGVPSSAFSGYDLGGVWRSRAYNNSARSKMMSDACSLLLNEYDYVIRVDTDEFLVADPRRWGSLTEYLRDLQRSYVTAAGYNIVSGVDSECLDLSKPILGAQRRQCYAYDALNKTCIVGLPTTWAPGFHFASVYPEFHSLYLFHMKFADIDMQVAIGAAVAGQSDEILFQEYHKKSRNAVEVILRNIMTFERVIGWGEFDRLDYRHRFLDSVKFTATYGGIYHGGPFQPDRVLLEIPDDFELRF
jgi:hypothetical protein